MWMMARQGVRVLCIMAVGRGNREAVEAFLPAGAKLGKKHWTSGSPVQVAVRGDVDMLSEAVVGEEGEGG
jgi:hypothetical protein